MIYEGTISWYIWQNSRTIRSGSSTRASLTRSITRAQLHLANAARTRRHKAIHLYVVVLVYGVARDGEVTEETKPNPQTAYAICKTLCERDLAR